MSTNSIIIGSSLATGTLIFASFMLGHREGVKAASRAIVEMECQEPGAFLKAVLKEALKSNK